MRVLFYKKIYGFGWKENVMMHRLFRCEFFLVFDLKENLDSLGKMLMIGERTQGHRCVILNLRYFKFLGNQTCLGKNMKTMNSHALPKN